MKLNADFNARVLIQTDRLEWVASPMPGVDRRMLDRVGEEVARATSIVRYAPKSKFSAHTHTGGEEFIVLDGVFQDEHGDYPTGTYVRNPPTSSHTPGSEAGCTIFVKLWQFVPDDRLQFRKDMRAELGASVDGVATARLHKDDYETVTFHTLDPNTSLKNAQAGGIEMLVISGPVQVGEDVLQTNAWLRLPDGTPLALQSGAKGASVWIKTGHLQHAVLSAPGEVQGPDAD